MAMYNYSLPGTTPPVPIPESTLQSADTALACLLIAVILVGVPGNISALVHFISELRSTNHRTKNRAYFLEIYITIATCDLLVTASVLPQIEGYLSRGRDSHLFCNTIFCTIWGVLWEVLPYFNVILVACLSFSRLVTLVRPMAQLRVKVFRASAVGYLIILVVSRTLPGALGNGSFKFDRGVLYCFLKTNNWLIQGVTCAVQIALPIIPIAGSCIWSIAKIHSLSSKFGKGTRTVERNRDATLTVILFTVIYLVYNLPIFMNYLLFIRVWMGDGQMYLEHYSTPFLYWYSWNVSFIV
eukprot:sb/3467417/